MSAGELDGPEAYLQGLPHASCAHMRNTWHKSRLHLQPFRRLQEHSAACPEPAVLMCEFLTRRQVKERQVEDHLFGDKEKFVTAAYKKELQERQLWEARQKIR